jgi:hypothetical protein
MNRPLVLAHGTGAGPQPVPVIVEGSFFNGESFEFPYRGNAYLRNAYHLAVPAHLNCRLLHTGLCISVSLRESGQFPTGVKEAGSSSVLVHQYWTLPFDTQQSRRP